MAPAAGRSAIPTSTKAHRIAENIDILDLELSADELQAIDVLDTGRGPRPEYTDEVLLSFGVSIPEARALALTRQADASAGASQHLDRLADDQS